MGIKRCAAHKVLTKSHINIRGVTDILSDYFDYAFQSDRLSKTNDNQRNLENISSVAIRTVYAMMYRHSDRLGPI